MGGRIAGAANAIVAQDDKFIVAGSVSTVHDDFQVSRMLADGGAGCITATSNLVAADLAFIHRHANDPAKAAEVEAAQARVVAARTRASRFAQMASLKALLAEKTGDAGWNRLRPPLLPLGAEERAALLAG